MDVEVEEVVVVVVVEEVVVMVMVVVVVVVEEEVMIMSTTTTLASNVAPSPPVQGDAGAAIRSPLLFHVMQPQAGKVQHVA